MKLNVNRLEDNRLVFIKGGNNRDYKLGEAAGNVFGQFLVGKFSHSAPTWFRKFFKK